MDQRIPPAELPFLPERHANLPELGRLTGRGNRANMAVVLAARPDLILNYGTINPTYTSLADRAGADQHFPTC